MADKMSGDAKSKGVLMTIAEILNAAANAGPVVVAIVLGFLVIRGVAKDLTTVLLEHRDALDDLTKEIREDRAENFKFWSQQIAISQAEVLRRLNGGGSGK